MSSRSVWLVVCLAACSQSSDGSLGLATPAGPRPIEVKKISELPELEAALRQDSDRVYGAHRRTTTVKYKVSGSAESDLEVTGTLESDGKGRWKATQNTSHEDGYEAIVVDGIIHVRPRYLQFTSHRLEPGEAARVRAPVEQALADELDQFSRWLTIERSDEPERLVLQLAHKSASADAHAPVAWRQTLIVDELTGRLELDRGSGALRRCTLAVTYHFTRDGKNVTVKLTHDETVDPGGGEDLTAPTGSTPTPRRVRPQLEKQTLLDGLPTMPARPR